MAAYYATANEAATKLLFLPSAVAGVLFPAFSEALARPENRAARLFDRAVSGAVLAVYPFCAIATLFSRPILGVWLGADYARHAAVPMQIIAAGVCANAAGMIAYAFVQAAGRPDLTARLHLLEAPVYLAALWWLLKHAGINGAAMAWAGRTAIDAVLLLYLSRKAGPISLRASLAHAGWLALLVASAVLEPYAGPAPAKAALAAAVLAPYLVKLRSHEPFNFRVFRLAASA